MAEENNSKPGPPGPVAVRSVCPRSAGAPLELGPAAAWPETRDTNRVQQVCVEKIDKKPRVAGHMHGRTKKGSVCCVKVKYPRGPS